MRDCLALPEKIFQVRKNPDRKLTPDAARQDYKPWGALLAGFGARDLLVHKLGQLFTHFDLLQHGQVQF